MFVSNVEKVIWPAITNDAGSLILSVLFQLEQSQWWKPEDLRAHQFRQLESLLSYSAENVPFYRERFTAADIQKACEEQDIKRLPLLTRDELQQAGKAIYTRNYPKSHGKPSSGRTSGSTGKPVETLSTGINILMWKAITLRNHFWHRSDFSKKLGVIRFAAPGVAEAPDGITSKNWGIATSGVIETAPTSLLSIFTPVSEQVEWLLKFRPGYLLTHPSVLNELLQYCEDEDIDMPFLERVSTISEMLPEGIRHRCRQTFGIDIIDTYSTIELGYLALQCPENEHYHVQSENVLLEVIDDNGNQCEAGEVGKVVVTNLHNYASPLIRYEVGDYAEVGEQCSCGRGLPVLKSIKGRYRNILTTPSGQRRFPRLGIQELYKIAPIQQFQAIQTSVRDIDVKLVIPRELTPGERQALEKHLEESLGQGFSFRLMRVDEVGRSAGGKFEEFISRL